MQYGRGVFSFATGLPNGNDSKFEGTGYTWGMTAGLMWKPLPAATPGMCRTLWPERRR